MKKILSIIAFAAALISSAWGQQLASSYRANGTAGNGFIQLDTQSSAPAAPATGGRLYFDSSNRLTWRPTGSGSMILVGPGGQTATYDTSGSIALTASGTAQPIKFVAGTSPTSKLVIQEYASDGYMRLAFLPTATTATAANSWFSGNGTHAYYGVATGGDHTFQINGSAKVYIASTGNLLLGGATTDGGLGSALQIPSSATTGIALYNTSDVTTNYEYLSLQWSANVANIITGKAGSGTGRALNFQTTTGSITFKPDGTTALTLDSSLTATFAGNIVMTNPKTFAFGTSLTIMSAPADGRLLLTSSAANDFGRIQLGGTTSSYPSLKRSGTEISFVLADDSASSPIRFSSGAMTGKMATYNGLTTAGYGLPVIVAAGRVTAQSAANSSIATYTLPATDGSFEVSANLNCTAATGLVTTLTCTYTDESNTARTMILPVQQLSGSFIAAGAITGTGAWETPVMHIRCKASTTITILTSTGTFNTVTYTAEGIIKQTS